jgi:Flp pilus assembly pilin Flp
MGKFIKRLFAGNAAAISVEAALIVVLLGAVIITTASVLHH